jgi:zinc protease
MTGTSGAWYGTLPAGRTTAIQTTQPTAGRQPIHLQTLRTPAGNPLFVYQLSNGHRVLIEQRPSELVSLRTFINTGSVNERPVLPSRLYSPTGLPSGIAHLDEHCHFLTTKNFPQPNSWTGALTQEGAWYNASTMAEMIQHEILLTPESLNTMIPMHHESVLGLSYVAPHLIQEKRNVVNEAREYISKPDWQICNRLWELLFERSAYQNLGKVSDVDQTRAEDLQAFFDMYYTPDNMLTTVSGNVQPAAVAMALEKYFGTNPPRRPQRLEQNLQIALRENEVRHATIWDPKLTKSQVSLAFPAPALGNFRDRAAMEIIANMLGQGSSSLLNQRLEEQLNLATRVSTHTSSFKQSGIANIQFKTEHGKEKEALAAALKVIQTLSTQSVSPQHLEETKKKLIYGFLRSQEISHEATMMAGSEALIGNLDYYLNYVQRIQSITPQDLMRVAQQYLNPRRYAVVFGVHGPRPTPASIQDQTELTGIAFRGYQK